MDDFQRLLRQQYGPFTGTTWLVVVGLGIAIAVFMRRYMGGGTSSSPAPSDDLDDGYTFGASPFGGRVPAGDFSAPIDTGTDPADVDPDAAYQDAITSWINSAVDALSGPPTHTNQTVYNAGQVWNALTKFAQGAPDLSSGEQAIVAAAIQAVGTPPQGTPYVPGSLPPDPTVDDAQYVVRPRFAFVQTYRGRLAVIDKHNQIIYDVATADVQRVNMLFGPPLTRQSQLPQRLQRKQNNYIKTRHPDVRRVLKGKIFLPRQTGWRKGSKWRLPLGLRKVDPV